MAYKPRVPLIDPQTATGETKRIFDITAKAAGRLPNTARVWANVPYIAKVQRLRGWALHREGAGGVLTARIKELAVLKTSHLNGCAY